MDGVAGAPPSFPTAPRAGAHSCGSAPPQIRPHKRPYPLSALPYRPSSFGALYGLLSAAPPHDYRPAPPVRPAPPLRPALSPILSLPTYTAPTLQYMFTVGRTFNRNYYPSSLPCGPCVHVSPYRPFDSRSFVFFILLFTCGICMGYVTRASKYPVLYSCLQ